MRAKRLQRHNLRRCQLRRAREGHHSVQLSDQRRADTSIEGVYSSGIHGPSSTYEHTLSR